MLRQAEMPKGSRQVPTVYDGFILGPPHGISGSAFALLAACSWEASGHENESLAAESLVVGWTRWRWTSVLSPSDHL